MVAFAADCLCAVLDGFNGAPLQAGKALFAVVQPGGFTFYYFDIFGGAHFGADAAFCAGVLQNEIFVCGRDLLTAAAVYQAREQFVYQPEIMGDACWLAAFYHFNDAINLFSGCFEVFLLGFL